MNITSSNSYEADTTSTTKTTTTRTTTTTKPTTTTAPANTGEKREMRYVDPDGDECGVTFYATLIEVPDCYESDGDDSWPTMTGKTSTTIWPRSSKKKLRRTPTPESITTESTTPETTTTESTTTSTTTTTPTSANVSKTKSKSFTWFYHLRGCFLNIEYFK